MRHKTLTYNRIVFGVIGTGVGVIFCLWNPFSEKSYQVSDDEYPDLLVYWNKSSGKKHQIPESVKSGNNWEKLGSKKIGNFCRIGEKIYWSGDETGNYVDNRNLIKEADAESFQLAPGQNYAKDRFHVYWVSYQVPMMAYAYDSDKKSTYSTSTNLTPVEVVSGADPMTFELLGYGFACDENKMYFEGQPIEWDEKLFNANVCKSTVELWIDFTERNVCNENVYWEYED